MLTFSECTLRLMSHSPPNLYWCDGGVSVGMLTCTQSPVSVTQQPQLLVSAQCLSAAVTKMTARLHILAFLLLVHTGIHTVHFLFTFFQTRFV